MHLCYPVIASQSVWTNGQGRLKQLFRGLGKEGRASDAPQQRRDWRDSIVDMEQGREGEDRNNSSRYLATREARLTTSLPGTVTTLCLAYGDTTRNWEVSLIRTPPKLEEVCKSRRRALELSMVCRPSMEGRG